MKYIFDNVNVPHGERIIETGTSSKTIYVTAQERIDGEGESKMQNIDTKSVVTLLVAIAVSLAFVFVVVAPAFNVIVPNTTSSMVFAMFGALAGFGGSQYGQAQAVKQFNAMQGK